MTTASLDLCKELYKLSGWDFESSSYPTDNLYHQNSGNGLVIPTLAILNKYPDKYTPAYDLGYLLRKLPQKIKPGLFRNPDSTNFEWSAICYARADEFMMTAKADTPEDCAAKLAIELFRQGVLK